MLIFSTCKKSAKHETKADRLPKDTIPTKNCVKLKELSIFYKKIESSCKTLDNEVYYLFSKELQEHYKQGFCELINDAIENVDGEIGYSMSEDCTGTINIISVENIVDEDGEEFRNEYATFLYVKKEKGELKIYSIGGAG